jgi:hypothetical protein
MGHSTSEEVRRIGTPTLGGQVLAGVQPEPGRLVVQTDSRSRF